MRFFILSAISLSLVACITPAKLAIKQAAFDHKVAESEVQLVNEYDSTFRLKINNQEKIYRDLPYVGIFDVTESIDQNKIDRSVDRSVNRDFYLQGGFRGGFFGWGAGPSLDAYYGGGLLQGR